MSARVPRVLSIAGSDPSGGAGIQADLATIAALGGYGMAVVTALTAQSTRGVAAVHAPGPAFVDAQLRTLSDDVAVDAVKLGMLHDAGTVAVVERWLADVRPPVVVLDPVMVATSGDRLLAPDAERAVRGLCERADLVTPNVVELAALVGEAPATTWDDVLRQARALAAATGAAVLAKGGHLDGPECVDAVVTAHDATALRGPRVPSRETHGTGCALSSAMATLAAHGATWEAALARAKPWLAEGIALGPALEVGGGATPVDRTHELRPALPTTSWADDAWGRAERVRADVDACAFVRALGAGELDDAAFRWYLAQDAVYLAEHARALARASALAPTSEEQASWARAAAAAIDEEARLHRAHGGDGSATPAPATRAYVDHLRASSLGGYAEIVAAVLPCAWLYADVGTRLAPLAHDGHPHRDWLLAYGDPAFAQEARRAASIADAQARGSGPATRERMHAAFAASMRHELAFFEAPMARALA